MLSKFIQKLNAGGGGGPGGSLFFKAMAGVIEYALSVIIAFLYKLVLPLMSVNMLSLFLPSRNDQSHSLFSLCYKNGRYHRRAKNVFRRAFLLVKTRYFYVRFIPVLLLRAFQPL